MSDAVTSTRHRTDGGIDERRPERREDRGAERPDDERDDAAGRGRRAIPGIDLDGGRRIAVTALGGALLVRCLRRRSVVGAATALVGTALLYRGVAGADAFDRALARSVGIGRGGPESGTADGATEVRRSVTVGKPADELHERWRDPEQLNRVVGRVADVSPAEDAPADDAPPTDGDSAAGGDRHRWSVSGPLGRTLEWETRVVEDRPGEVLRWESIEGATVPSEGSVRFRSAPADRGTEVTLRLRYDPPGGSLGAAAMQRLGIVPDALAGAALRRFKSLAETGEIPTLERNPSARGSGDLV